jgi:hypothetical protein
MAIIEDDAPSVIKLALLDDNLRGCFASVLKFHAYGEVHLCVFSLLQIRQIIS